MKVKVEINGRQFTLNWDEFENMMAKKDVDTPVEILSID